MSEPASLPARVAELYRVLVAHRPRDEREEASLGRILRELERPGDPFDEHTDPTHVTGSAIVLDPQRHVLLHLHRILELWMQPGGHVDPGEDPPIAARREAHEETGILASHPQGSPLLVHVDVHPGPRGHTHLDLRYLLRAPRLPPAPPPGESPHVAWFPPDEALVKGDESLRSAVAAALDATADA